MHFPAKEPVIVVMGKAFPFITGENLDAVIAVTDSCKMADTFAGDRTSGAVAQTSAQTIDINV